jgi:hypothetical protein
MPDYKIVEWSERNYPSDKSEYVRWCVENKRWAFLSDYVKADVLAEHGGVFLDADVIAHRDLGSFLSHRAFSGFECSQLPFTAVWAAEAGHPWPIAALEYMDKLDGESIGEPNTYWMARLLEEQFGIDPLIDTYQEGTDDVVIYPSETLCLGAHVGWTSHLFAGSWLPEGARGIYGLALNDRREAAARLEMSAPALAIGVARLLAFGDPESTRVAVSSRGTWISDELPEVVGLGRATRALTGVGKYLVSLYMDGVKKAVLQRFGRVRGDHPDGEKA